MPTSSLESIETRGDVSNVNKNKFMDFEEQICSITKNIDEFSVMMNSMNYDIDCIILTEIRGMFFQKWLKIKIQEHRASPKLDHIYLKRKAEQYQTTISIMGKPICDHYRVE